MRIVLLFVAVCAIVACAPPSNLVQWAPFNQGLLTHATILSIAIDPNHTNTIYAGAYDLPSAYVSTDHARNWRADDNGLNAPVLALQFIGDRLFSGTINGLFQLQGNRWERVESIPAAPVYAISRGSEGAYYLATDRHGIFSTNDAGATWTRIAGLENEISLSVAVLDRQTIVVGTSGHGAFITRDGGASWGALDRFAGDYVSFILIDQRDNQSIFLRTRGGLVRSRDRGISWEILQGGIEHAVVNALLITSSGLYAATSSGVLASIDDGASWRAQNDGLPEGSQPLALAQVDGRTMLVATQTGIYITIDGGDSWQAANNGLGSAMVHDIAFANAGALFAATEDGLFESNSEGGFHQIGNEAMHVPMLSVIVAPSNPKTIYAGSYRHGIFVSKDGGETWGSVGDIFQGRLAAPGLAIDPGDDRTVFARVLFQRIYKSGDGGDNWHAVWTGMSDDTEVETMSVAPSDPTTLFAGTNFGIFISRNGGESWTPRGLSDNSSRWASYQNVFAVWVDPRDPRKILAGATDGLYKSSDSGESWSRTTLASMTITAIIHDAMGRLIAGTKYNGVWSSNDDAATWTRLGTGLDGASVNTLVSDEESGMLYSATTRGLYKTRP